MTKTEITKQAKGKSIYMELPNGYFVRVSLKNLQSTLSAILNHDNEIKGTYTIAYDTIHIKLK